MNILYTETFSTASNEMRPGEFIFFYFIIYDYLITEVRR